MRYCQIQNQMIEKKCCWVQLSDSKYEVTVSDKFDITYDRKVNDKLINFGQQLLKAQFSEINGFQDCCYVPVQNKGVWKYSLKMKFSRSTACQIHHTGADHWVTSVSPANETDLIVFDSLQGPVPSISNSLKMQLFAAYAQNKNHLNILIPKIQQQANSVDCGIFALAYATEICFTGFVGGESIDFDKQIMREHLLNCFQNKSMSPFPKIKRKLRLKPVKITYQQVFLSKD